MAEQVVELNPGESKQVSFEATPNEARTFQVSVDGLTGSFKAVPPPPPFLVESRGSESSIYMMGPASAKAGDEFNIYVAILNWDFEKSKPIVDFTIYGEPVMTIDGAIKEGSYKTITPVAPTYEMTEYGLWPKNSWKFKCTMPAKPLNVKADGWIEDSDIPWHKDATVSKEIPLG